LIQPTHPATGECLTVLANVQALQIIDQASLDWTGLLLAEVKTKAKELDAELKSFTKPHREAEAKVRAWFKPALDAAAALEAALKAKIGAYHLAQSQAQAKALQAAAEQFQEGNQAAGVIALAAIPETVAATKGVGVRTVEKFRVVNPDLVPREACSPDDAKIKALRALGREIPGVEFYTENQVSVRTK
jgi:hypothetical protein